MKKCSCSLSRLRTSGLRRFSLNPVCGGAAAAFAVLVWLGSAGTLRAQSAPHLDAHTFEVGGFVGSSYGLDDFRVMGGGNVTYGVTKHILPYFEYSYFPGITRELDTTFQGTGRPVTFRFDIPFSDVHAGVHIRMPIRESRFVPYGVIGLGMLRAHGRTVTAQYTDISGQPVLQPLGIDSSSDFAANFGGGLRWYARQNWGMRLEAKVYKPTGTFTTPFGKMEWGFFFQFR